MEKRYEKIEELKYALLKGETRRFYEHPNLKALEVIFENEEEEIIVDFCVPTEWLLKEERFDCEESLDLWLQNDYTSEDSERIMNKACDERQIHVWRIY